VNSEKKKKGEQEIEIKECADQETNRLELK